MCRDSLNSYLKAHPAKKLECTMYTICVLLGGLELVINEKRKI